MKNTIALIVMISLAGIGIFAQDVELDVFAVMKEVDTISSMSLWPGFNPSEIPAAVYDGKNTYLFQFANSPAEFVSVADRPGVLVYSGQHPRVLGNSRVQIDGVWAATSVLQQRSPLTGDLYTLEHLAAIVIHEMFHVFQRLRHPEWRPDEAVLFAYPEDTAERLRQRRMEMQSFVRALECQEDDEAAAWAATALRYREERLSGLDSAFSLYEDELQRFEGLGEYIERKAAGQPLSSDDRYQEFSPGVIRDLGYLEGRWMAGLLDRLDPSWKNEMEAGGFQYLRERLFSKLEGVVPKSFSEEESKLIEATAGRDFLLWQEKRAELREKIQTLAGFRVVVDAAELPLVLGMFFATHAEALTPREMLHRRLFMARNSAGSVEIRRHDCVTVADGPSSIVRVVIPGLTSKPEILRSNGHVSLRLDGISLEFDNAVVSESSNTITVKLQSVLSSTRSGFLIPGRRETPKKAS